MHLRTLLLLALTVTAPAAAQAVTAGPAGPAVVEGRVELTPASADAAARALADREVRWELERRGRDLVRARSPGWLPGLIGDLVLDRWLRSTPVERTWSVVDVERERHAHEGYDSHRTRLWIATDEREVARALSRLHRQVEKGSRRFALFAGGTAAWWALCALACGWLDRLTRGYMPWRLRLVCVGMGVVAPGIALFFV